MKNKQKVSQNVALRQNAKNRIVTSIADYVYANPDKKVEEVLSHFVAKHKKDRRTIQRHLQLARNLVSERIKYDEEARQKVMDAEAIEAAKMGIMSRNEALQNLSKIAKGTARKVNDKVVSTTYADQIKATEMLARLQGWNAPEVTEITGKGGEPLLPPQPPTKEQLETWRENFKNEFM
jgi:hypothetical protein